MSLTRGALKSAQPRLYRRKDDGLVTNLATGSTTSLTAANTYEAKVTVDEDPNNPGTQRLRFYVDDEGNGFADDPAVLTDTTYVDQDWPLTQRVPQRGTDREAIAELRSDR